MLRFLANVDPIDVARATSGLCPTKTLVMIISKTFTTAETMLNAKSVKQWLKETLKTEEALGEQTNSRHAGLALHACMHAFMRLFTCIHVFVCMHACVRLHACMCLFACMHLFVCMHACRPSHVCREHQLGFDLQVWHFFRSCLRILGLGGEFIRV